MGNDENDKYKLEGGGCLPTGSREYGYDLLRTVGLYLIILAHANPPLILANLRSFDVVLMVFVSGATLALHPVQLVNYRAYLKKRVLRLLMPGWIFLTVFFLFTYILFQLNRGEYPFSLDVIVDSYLLNHGIGYVWIIRVFLLVALSAPLLLQLSNCLSNDWVYLTVIFFVYCLYELFLWLCRSSEFLSQSSLLQDFFFYLIPYSCVLAVGIRVRFMTARKILLLCIIILFLFFGSAAVAGLSFMELNEYKYPPRWYYLSYGISISLLAYLLVEYIHLKGLIRSFVVFSSKSSMWIYLWHIFVLYMWQWFSPMWAEQVVIKFVLIVFLSILIVNVQISIVTAVVDRFGWEGKKLAIARIAFL